MRREVSPLYASPYTAADDRGVFSEVLPWLFVFGTAFGTAGLMASTAKLLDASHLAMICVASTSFVMIPVAGGALGSAYGWCIFAGLVGCWWGDMLGFHGQFIASVAAFLLGHVAFSAAFFVRGVDWGRLLQALPFVFFVALTVVVWILPFVDNPVERIAVCAYCVVISSMVLSALGASEGSLGKLIAAGAIVFFVSDIFVARWKYVPDTMYNAYFCYPLYYLSCVLMGLTAVVYRKTAG